MFVIRQATVVDAPELAECWQQMSFEGGIDDPDTKAWFKQQALGIESGTVLCALASENGHVAGFADGTLAYEPGTRSTTLVGRHLFVHCDARGHRLGERMMLRLLALSRQSGASSLLVHGIHSRRAIEKFLGPMQKQSELWVAKW